MKNLLICYNELVVDYTKLFEYTKFFRDEMNEKFDLEKTREFMQERLKTIQDIQQKEALILQSQGALGEEQAKSTNDNLNELSATIKKIIEDIQSIDEQLINLMKMELEATKLEISRSQSVRHANNFYRRRELFENKAHFINKVK